MTPPDALERDLATTLCAAADDVPPEVTHRLLAGLPDAPTSRRRWPVTAALVAAVVLIAAVPAVLVARGGDQGAPDRTATSATASVDPAPTPVEIAGETWDGAPVALSDYRGAPVLVVVWGSWCAPCRRQVQAAQELQEQYRVPVLGIAVREGSREASGAAEVGLGLTYPSLYDGSGDLAGLLPGMATSLPFTVLLDARGRVIGEWLGSTDDDSMAHSVELATGPEPLLTGDVLENAGRLAREATVSNQGVDVVATASVERGTVTDFSNGGEPCPSGWLVQIQVAGTFDGVVYAGGPGAHPPVSALELTADLASGKLCQSGVTTGPQPTAPGAVVIYES